MLPDSTPPSRLDQSLRNAFSDFRPQPSGAVWRGIAPRIGPPGAPPPRWPRRWLPLWFGLVALLAGLGGWLLPHPGPTAEARLDVAVVRAATPATKAAAPRPAPLAPAGRRATVAAEVASTAARLAAAPMAAGLAQPTGQPAAAAPVAVSAAPLAAMAPAYSTVLPATPPATFATPAPARPNATGTLPPAADTTAAVATLGAAVPARLRRLVALERTAQEYRATPPAPDHTRRAALLAALLAQRTELARLQAGTDSLLLALGEAPAVAADALAAADTAAPAAAPRPWSLLLLATPEQTTLASPLASNDPLTALRNQETGRDGIRLALLAERQLTPRWSVAAGLGYQQYRTELRLTDRRTDVAVTYDTTRTATSTDYTSTNRVYSIRLVQVPQLSPIFNASGQVLRYDTVYTTRADTTYTTIVQHDNVRTDQRTITPLLSRTEVVSTQTLRPTYRFFTLPVQLRYRLAAPGPARWWADVAAGAQLQLFLGGTQLVSTDGGQSFRTEDVRAGQGPFRPVSLALTGSLNLNYALTNRLSLSAGPSLRWQALSVYRPETGLRQQPVATGVQVGLHWKL